MINNKNLKKWGIILTGIAIVLILCVVVASVIIGFSGAARLLLYFLAGVCAIPFFVTVALLKAAALAFGTTYVVVNIWFFCFLWPFAFYVLYMALVILLGYKIFKERGLVWQKLLLVVFFLFGGWCLLEYPSVPYILNNTGPIFNRCVDLMYKMGGAQDIRNLEKGMLIYIIVNVVTLCIIWPVLFFALLTAVFKNLRTLRRKLTAWQLNAGLIVLFVSAIAMQYGIYVLIKEIVK